MGGFWPPLRKSDERRGGSAGGRRPAAGAFACMVLSMLGLVIPPVVGKGSPASFVVATTLLLVGAVGFTEVLKRGGDDPD